MDMMDEVRAVEIKGKLSYLQMEHRREAARQAEASFALEGIIIPPEHLARERALEELWIKGEISHEEFLTAPV